MTRRRLLKTGALLAMVSVPLVALASSWIAGSYLSAPAFKRIGLPPAELSAEPVEFSSESGSTIRGWFIPGSPGSGAVVLMHGVRGNRWAMADRAYFLHGEGYSVLLFDFQAHGDSTGTHITFGYLEARDAHAAVDYLRQRVPGERVAAIGTSLGGAATLLGDTPLNVDALVLEAVYPDLNLAIRNRLAMRLGSAGPWLTPLLTWQFSFRMGVSIDALRPIDGIARVECPILMIAGTADRHTTLEESRQLFAAAPEPRSTWEIEGAAHVDFYRFAPEEYEARVGQFLRANLSRSPHSAGDESPVAGAQ